MGALFSTATSTIAWLGETGGESDLVYSYISTSQSSIGYIHDTRQALSCLLNREYWSRVWVIQEFLLPLHLYVWWDGYRMRAQDFSQIVWTMAGLSSRCKPQYPSIWNTPGRNLLQYRERYQRMSHSQDVSSEDFRKIMGLRPLLQWFSTSKCSLIHDRVYGLLGIATDTAHSTWPIIPDYERSLEELLLDVLQNQRREEPDSTEGTWRLIKDVCNTLELKADELVALAFHNAPKIERELHILMCRFKIGVPYSLYGVPSPRKITDLERKRAESGFPDFYSLLQGTLQRWRQEGGCINSLRGSIYKMKQERMEMAALESSVRCIRQQEGCLVALGKYLGSCPLAEPRVPSHSASIDALIVGLRHTKTTRSTEEITRWCDPNTSEVVKLLYSLGQQPFYLGRSHLVFMHKSLGVHTGRCPLSAVSYHSFGKFGIALVLKCSKDCGWYACRYPKITSDPNIVGRAFFCKRLC